MIGKEKVLCKGRRIKMEKEENNTEICNGCGRNKIENQDGLLECNY
ncbi:MAG: hypothetical protein WC587_03815 [Candidatus Paceibacterota bacterium]